MGRISRPGNIQAEGGRLGGGSRNRWSFLPRAVATASLVLATGVTSAAAQEPAQVMKSPRISSVHVDWNAVAADVTALGAFKPDGGREATPAADVMASLNRTTGEHFARIAESPVPVLLPFDTAAFLRDRALIAHAPQAPGATASLRLGGYLSGFSAVPFFYPGPGGYDAVIAARAQDMPDLGIAYPEPIYVHVGGSALLYDLDEPVGMIGWPVTGLDDIPGIRRIYVENYVRYTFVRFGVPYVVAVDCFDGGARFGKIACRDADKVAVRLIKSLRIVGGTPRHEADATTIDTLDRPSELSTVFTYHSPGDLIPGTGFKGKAGSVDRTVYSRIRFPLADAPAFANSQSFMSWGDCDGTGRYGAGMRDGFAAYRCRVGGDTLIADEGAAENYSYPWRDNFCETRDFSVGQCPGGFGHQGQDIRPTSCRRAPGANRCEPYLHDAVAVRDGMVLRAPNQQSILIVVNAPNERIRFRYLHMLPRQLDADGFFSGRLVREGEVIGKVGNFYKHERGTSYHLHFDVQVPTRNGWVFVNPYMTLVAAYERLIRGRGQEIEQINEQAIKQDAGPDAKPESRPDKKPAIGEAIPTASATVKGLLPQPAQTPRAPLVRAIAAAKPTETPLESAPATSTDSGTSEDARTRPLEDPLTADAPADTRSSDRGPGDPKHGAGAGK
jgi:hypothetical protein